MITVSPVVAVTSVPFPATGLSRGSSVLNYEQYPEGGLILTRPGCLFDRSLRGGCRASSVLSTA